MAPKSDPGSSVSPADLNPNPTPNPNDRVLHVWEMPVDGADDPVDGTAPNKAPTIGDAMGMIKKEDFVNIVQTPCSRQGLLTGIGAGAGVGGLSFVVRGNFGKSANWAVGAFFFGSVASYEYCQFLRRAERIKMKRQIEIVTDNRRDQAKKLTEAREQHKKLEEEQKVAQRPWYKVW